MFIRKTAALACTVVLLMSGTVHGQDGAAGFAIEEIIVTASKRETVLADTAMSITAIGAEEIERKSLFSADDYLNSVPSTRFESYGLGENQLVIRGLGVVAGQQPTAGYYLGDIPLSDALSSSLVDIKLVDMNRVEVLRGPQGTLYGAGAMGGAVRNIPNRPVLGEFEGSLKVTYADVEHTGDASHGITGTINIPLADDTMALRATAYSYEVAGVVDLISTANNAANAALFGLPEKIENDTGGQTFTGARASLLLAPSDGIEASLIVGYQELEEDGRSELAISSNDYVFSLLDHTNEFRKQDTLYANLLLDFDLGWGEFVSSTSYTNTETSQNFSHTRLFASPTSFRGVPDSDKTGLYQEFRISTNVDGPSQFVAGLFYEDIDDDGATSITWDAEDTTLLPLIWGTDDVNAFSEVSTSELQQVAVFGEYSYDFNDSFRATVGGRWFDYERTDNVTTRIGGFAAFGIPAFVLPSGDLTISEDGTNFKGAIEYRANDDALLYANWSEGFRLGLTQDNTALFLFFGGFCDVNPQDGLIDGTNLPFNNRTDLKSDNLDTIEIGAKVSSSNGRWNVHAAAFRTDWDNIPVTVVVPVNGLGCSSTFNGGKARSQGIEVESAFLATENLQFNIALSYVDTEFLDDLAGKQGEQLPFAPQNSASVGAQYSFDLANRESYIRVDWSYVDESLTSFGAPDVVTTDSYSKLDMRAGIRFERFDLALFGTNLTDENALVGVVNLDRGWRLRPRTIGIEASILF